MLSSSPDGTALWFDGNGYYTGTWSHSSDARLKKDVRDLSYGLDDLLKLRPVTFKWKRDADPKTHLGLIAQEVEKIVPEVVSHASDPSSQAEVMTIDYTEMLPLLIKAVQEQQARIVALERARSSTKLASILGGGALLGLVPLGLVVASRRRKVPTPSR